MFPGEKSPGLIEARSSLVARPRLVEFPGEKSPGLIEAESSNLTLVPIILRFRGRNPPASLKPAEDL